MTLEINATIDHEVVPFPVQNYYQGRIRNLRRGTYTLLVVHVVHSDTTYSVLAFHQEVRVR